MSKALIVFFNKENDANKSFFANLKSGKYFMAMILPVNRKRAGKRIKDTSKRAPRLDPVEIAKILGADIIDFDLIDGYNHEEFTLTLELGTDFRNEDGKIIFFKDERLMTFDCGQILQIINMNTGKPVWERE